MRQRGLTARSGCCQMSCIGAYPFWGSGSPFHSTLPETGFKYPAMIWANVLFPYPEGPTSPTLSPSSISRFIFFRIHGPFGYRKHTSFNSNSFKASHHPSAKIPHFGHSLKASVCTVSAPRCKYAPLRQAPCIGLDTRKPFKGGLGQGVIKRSGVWMPKPPSFLRKIGYRGDLKGCSRIKYGNAIRHL